LQGELSIQEGASLGGTMQVELRKNGKLQILLKATDDIELLILDSMVAKAQNGQPVKLVKQDGCAVISMGAE
jgi:hypothetical protein